MKICYCIAEYNPLHLGHVKHINYIKNSLGTEKLVVIMSGNFTQRGEPAVLNKFVRAKEAVIAGADAVIELPAVFSTGNAETFAKGAINIISSLNAGDGICFGVESGKKEDYVRLATALNDESKEFRSALKEFLSQGFSLAKAKYETVKKLNKTEFDETLVSSPNNVLAIEYVKALLKIGSPLEAFPMIREGDHNDPTLKKGITSASSIRSAIKSGAMRKIKKCVPPYVFRDLKNATYPYAFDKMIMSSLIRTSAKDLSKVPDCTEGLENRIKALSKDNLSVASLVEKTTTKRYTSSRIRRILVSNYLGISSDLVSDCEGAKLYAKILAVNNDSKDLVSLLAKTSSVPLITRKSDATSLKKTALDCFNVDVRANDLYNLATDEKTNEHQTIFV